MLDHLALYLLPYLGAAALIITGICIWDDYRNGYISNPFKK